MIILSGLGAALSALAGSGNAPLRAMILGSCLALSIVDGDWYIKRGRHKDKLSRALIGMFWGLAAGMLAVILDTGSLRSPMSLIDPHEPVEYTLLAITIVVSVVYGALFSLIVTGKSKRKFLKLLIVAFVCISIKEGWRYLTWLNFGGRTLELLIFSLLSAFIFVILWYLPVWFFYVRKPSITAYLKCLPLNLRMLKLVLAKRWLAKEDYATSYDEVAATYDDQWLCQLRPVTEKLLNALPGAGDGDILDLGCGTGLSTLYLEKKYPDNPVIGIDISPAMLEIAGKKCSQSEFIEDDILEFLRKRPDNSAALIFSGWAIGYSSPAKIIKEARRVLKPEGAFAFVVNYYDTLAPVFYAFRKCMNQFPGQVNMALNPNFPRNARDLLMQFNGFTIQLHEDGNIPIHAPDDDITLEWLLKTGVLAGFDQVMPLRDNQEIAAYFNKVLKETDKAVEHHYFMGVFIKQK
jgi:ubiquinone/menaquinone biosynthesis C-methylase UbiE